VDSKKCKNSPCKVRKKKQNQPCPFILEIGKSDPDDNFLPNIRQNSLFLALQNLLPFTLFCDMTLQEAQQIVDDWIQKVGVRYFNELTNTAILMEEVGEVARIMARQYGEQSFKESDKAVNLADEMADVLFVLICLANQTGVNLENALRQNLAKKTQRDAERHQNNEKLKS
jgi:NTP pyrophosphatase (non-canonical NTP hydrolase)